MKPDKIDQQADAPGRRAFEMEFGRISAGIVVSDNDIRLKDVSRAISKARAAADQGDFIGAIKLLGDVKITLTPAQAPALDAGVKPEDVEQALGDLRRAIKKSLGAPGIETIQTLCRAARESAIQGRWEAAWALIDEADQRMGEGPPAKGSR